MPSAFNFVEGFAVLVSMVAPVSVETQNFASVHKESRHGTIVQDDLNACGVSGFPVQCSRYEDLMIWLRRAEG